MDNPQVENISPHELLARRFEQWQKEYMDRVNLYFSQENDERGDVAFQSWEQRFLPFLEQEAPSLVQIYVASVRKHGRTRYFGQSIYSSWKNYKGNAVEAFLTQAIDDARYGHIAPQTTQSVSVLPAPEKDLIGKAIFIGHGGSSDTWKQLKDFVQDRLKLQWDEFDRESTPGFTTVERLEMMLKQASFAFLVMTAEDEHADGSIHARENVIHETGLFQGHLGFRKAIVLVEDGCNEFSNIKGLIQIRFPKGNISAKFEEIRRVLS
jgi:hypothetical protein